MGKSLVSQRLLTRAMGGAAALALIVGASLGAGATTLTVSAAPEPYLAVPGSYIAPSGATTTGDHSSNAQMTVALVLQPNHAAEMQNVLTQMYTPGSTTYHQWLQKGQFNARFDPSQGEVKQAQQFLSHAGLQVQSDPSPFLIRATGTTAQIEATFRTHIKDYRSSKGVKFFSNDSSAQLPRGLSGSVLGVVGLSNTVREKSHAIATPQAAKQAGKKTPQYGAAPGGSGLTPSQTEGIYDANGVYKAGPRGQGARATLAVFELSGYTRSDIYTFEHQFFGPRENVPLVDVPVDGGPITPACPTGDFCGPFVYSPTPGCTPVPGAPGAYACDSADYSGDIEVEADLDNQIAVAPKISSILVYNAPNDELGLTEIDEYSKIAQDDAADSISSSWGVCEQDAGKATAEAEYFTFAQMAAQGQSMFAAAGDTGAYDCIRDGTANSNGPVLAVDDPATQPYVTSVGGTSFSSYDPGSDQHPSYPGNQLETVWNVLDLCSGTASGLSNCAATGAGGGGNSVFWGRPAYQRGPGVNSKYTTYYPSCTLAANGQACRSAPDVSANADEYTPYAEYCTGDPSTNSVCATFSASQPAPGWFGIGGTSLSSPLWSAVIALNDSFHGHRFGNANFGLYALFNQHNSYKKYFHDITGRFQTENNNGYFPVTPNYDRATGIGTPRITAIAKA